VHDLRVSIRRLRAHFRAVRLILPGFEDRRAVVGLRRLMRHLSRFRDLQVQQAMAGKLLAENPCLSDYMQRLEEDEISATRLLAEALASFSEDLVADAVSTACRGLDEARSRGPDMRRLAGRLAGRHQRLIALRSAADPSDPATIHRLRVAFKKYRYLVEPLARFSGNPDPAVLARMHDLQGAMGDVQDLAVLGHGLRSWAARAGKRKEADPSVRLLTVRLDERIATLMPMLSAVDSFDFPFDRGE